MSHLFSASRWTLALAAVAGCAVAAQAQFRAGGDGRLLERDLGVYNSGGLAGRDLTSSFRFARNVSFGRAGGGFSFMGDLGTQDYSDFVGGLGSNDLRDFRNRSQGSALSSRGVRASDTASYIQSLTSGTRRPNAFRGSYELPSSTYSKSFEFDTSPDFTGLPMVSNANSGRRRAGLLTDPLRQSDADSQRRLGASGGRGLPSLADSLGSTRLSAGAASRGDLGVDPAQRRSSRPDTLSGLTGRGLDNKGVGALAPPGTTTPRSLEESRIANETARRSMRESAKSRASAAPDRLDTSIDTSLPDTNLGPARQDTSRPALPSSYDRLLERLDKMAAPPGSTQDVPETTIPGVTPRQRPAERGAPGTNPPVGVTGRLEDLRSRLNRGAPVAASADDSTPSARLKPVTGLVGGSDWLTRKSSTLVESGAVLSSAERAAREAARTRAQRSVVVPGQSPEAVDPNAPRAIPDLDPETLRVIREAGGMVDAYMPVDASKRDPFGEHIAAGVEAMANGQYFQADDRFTSAAGIRPTELSAQFGRIHAQLGGATFKSAATNLRRMFRTRPEVAAMRYDPKLLPGADRIADLALRLRGLYDGQEGQTARDAALLAAYLGFQTGDTALRDEGLARLETLSAPDRAESDPRDAVLARFLRGVWEKAPDAPAPEPEEKGGK
ncbi:MAG: hypothetical protein GIKADHBN_00509 [Phycisphaerales bacterium]|nr:hypothetical protein [Phycisphaerales bacterium]